MLALVPDSSEGGRGEGWDKGASAFRVSSALSENYHLRFFAKVQLCP